MVAGTAVQFNGSFQPLFLYFRIVGCLTVENRLTPLSNSLAKFAAGEGVMSQSSVEVGAVHPFAIVASVHAGIQVGGEAAYVG